jgi:hypothetical protein
MTNSYEITIEYRYSFTTQVDAETEEEAIEQAKAEVPSLVSLSDMEEDDSYADVLDTDIYGEEDEEGEEDEDFFDDEEDSEDDEEEEAEEAA